MSQIVLSCPECGERMRNGFRRVCRRCGAQLVMVPQLFRPYHIKAYVKGPRAALASLAVGVSWFLAFVAVLHLIATALK